LTSYLSTPFWEFLEELEKMLKELEKGTFYSLLGVSRCTASNAWSSLQLFLLSTPFWEFQTQSLYGLLYEVG